MHRWNKPHVGLFALRLALGLIFFLHGWMNVSGGRQSFVREMLAMTGWSLPDVLWWAVTAVELLCGSALLVGVLTREAAAVLSLEMMVATLLFHLRQGFFIVAIPNVPLAYGFEYHVALVGGLVCLVFAGPGMWALESRARERGAASGRGTDQAS